jgi:hypothetical protein
MTTVSRRLKLRSRNIDVDQGLGSQELLGNVERAGTAYRLRNDRLNQRLSFSKHNQPRQVCAPQAVRGELAIRFAHEGLILFGFVEAVFDRREE